MNARTTIALLVGTIVVLSAQVTHASYKTELKKASSNARLYDLNTGNAKLLMRATLFTDAFRKAFAQHHAELNYMGAIEAGAYVGQQELLQSQEWQVFISMYTRKDYRKFNLRKDTFWKAYLTSADGDAVAPIRIEKLKKTPYWLEMFPYIDQWSDIYMLTFPKARLGDKTELTMESVVGYRAITFTLR